MSRTAQNHLSGNPTNRDLADNQEFSPRILPKPNEIRARLSLPLPLERREAVFKRKPMRELEPPPIASSNSQASEVLRVWAAPGQPQQLTLKTTWKDSGAWGLLLADIARHAATAYANEGHNPTDVLARIRQLMDSEFSGPTDTPVTLN